MPPPVAKAASANLSRMIAFWDLPFALGPPFACLAAFSRAARIVSDMGDKSGSLPLLTSGTNGEMTFSRMRQSRPRTALNSLTNPAPLMT